MVETKKRVSIGLTDEQYRLVEDLSKSRGFSKSAIFVLALEEYAKSNLKNKERKPKPLSVWQG